MLIRSPNIKKILKLLQKRPDSAIFITFPVIKHSDRLLKTEDIPEKMHDISVFFLTFLKNMIYYEEWILQTDAVFRRKFCKKSTSGHRVQKQKNEKTVKKYEKKGGFNLTNRIFQYRFTEFDFTGRVTYKK